MARRDIFAEIGARQVGAEPISDRKAVLIEPQPPELPNRKLPTNNNPSAAFQPRPTFDEAALQRELVHMRGVYAPFLQNLAPRPQQTRSRIDLRDFNWRLQTSEDLGDFFRPLSGAGEWEQLTIPHYGGPIGRAVSFYRTTFTLDEAMFARGSIFLHFNGVDYKGHAFVNGAYVGSHEGFFGAFEFDITAVAHRGENTLLVKVENDAIIMGNDSWSEDGHLYEGDKIYSAGGPNWDDPNGGWQSCPPGFGIFQDVYLEARPRLFVHDIFVRPVISESRAEAWIEVWNCDILRHNITLEISVYGQNFEAVIFENEAYELTGDGAVGPGPNYFRLPFEIPDMKIWDLDTPWLYQLQARVTDVETGAVDVASRQFGMRSFTQDENSTPKGRYYLNGREIRLRGANTMGFEQQDVMRKNWQQLIDDILLAKIGNLNFFRLTQRPVQDEVYEYADRLGFMLQSDLPLFAVLRRNQFVEAARQAGEMERLVRAHPSNIAVTYINEPFPNAWGKANRHLTRPELENFFEAASLVVHLHNPDRVIKPVDGDYDPPAVGLPDNHCYCGWYNGHGVDLGKLNRGYWQKVKPGWMYACGEFGAEGLDPVNVMRKYYPREWLPQSPEEEATWSPNAIRDAQTGRFHYLWFETPKTLDGWADSSRKHQAWVTKLMTEAMRRDTRMNSFAIHLFIDAFPDGWMKTIMDVDRQPKPSYFVYREILTPLMVSLRTDRYAYFGGESVEIEAWVCNDPITVPEGVTLHYQMEMDGKTIFSQSVAAEIKSCDSAFQGYLTIPVPKSDVRKSVTMRAGLIDANGNVLHDAAIELDVFPSLAEIKAKNIAVVGDAEGNAAGLVNELGLSAVRGDEKSDIILIDEWYDYEANREEILRAVEQGATAIFLNLSSGEYEIAGDLIRVDAAGMNARHFVSRDSGHPLVEGFETNDFRFWFDELFGYVTPFLKATFEAEGWTPILLTGNGGWRGEWGPALAAAEKSVGKGLIRIVQPELRGRLSNPAAQIFTRRLFNL